MSNTVELSDDECSVEYVHDDSVEVKVRYWNNNWDEYEYTSIYLNKQDLLNMLKLLEENKCE